MAYKILKFSLPIFIFIVCLAVFPQIQEKIFLKHKFDQKQIEKLTFDLKEKYGIDIAFDVQNSELFRGILYQKSSSAEQWLALTAFGREMNKYPLDYVRDSLKIKKIYLVNNLSVENFRGKTGKVRAVTIPEGYLFLQVGDSAFDTNTLFGWNKEKKFIETLHHELSHVADNNENVFQLDKAWYGLNEDGKNAYVRSWNYDISSESYNIKGRQNFWQYYLGLPPKGFISIYSLENEQEDRAEVIGRLMTGRIDFSEVSADPVVFAKVNLAVALLFRRSNGQLKFLKEK